MSVHVWSSTLVIDPLTRTGPDLGRAEGVSLSIVMASGASSAARCRADAGAAVACAPGASAASAASAATGVSSTPANAVATRADDSDGRGTGRLYWPLLCESGPRPATP